MTFSDWVTAKFPTTWSASRGLSAISLSSSSSCPFHSVFTNRFNWAIMLANRFNTALLSWNLHTLDWQYCYWIHRAPAGSQVASGTIGGAARALQQTFEPHPTPAHVTSYFSWSRNLVQLKTLPMTHCTLTTVYTPPMLCRNNQVLYA